MLITAAAASTHQCPTHPVIIFLLKNFKINVILLVQVSRRVNSEKTKWLQSDAVKMGQTAFLSDGVDNKVNKKLIERQ